jgi:hypothetical protein
MFLKIKEGIVLSTLPSVGRHQLLSRHVNLWSCNHCDSFAVCFGYYLQRTIPLFAVKTKSAPICRLFTGIRFILDTVKQYKNNKKQLWS